MADQETVFFVVTTYSFSPDVEIKPFKTRAEAKDCIGNEIKEERRIAIEEDGIAEEDIEVETDGTFTELSLFPKDAMGEVLKESIQWTIKEMEKRELTPE